MYKESLAIRAIIAEAGGGSTDTVREELERAARLEAAPMVSGNKHLQPPEREAALRAQLNLVTSERDALRKGNMALEHALRRASQSQSSLQVIEHQVSEIERRVQGAIKQILREAARLRRVRARSMEAVVVPDATLEARYNKLILDHARLIAKFTRLNGLYFEATGERFE